MFDHSFLRKKKKKNHRQKIESSEFKYIW